MAVYSFSQIQTYVQCPLSYKFKYVDKIKPEFEENLHLILGITVHSTLEYLYNKINNFCIPSFNELENYFLKDYKEKVQKLDNVDDEEVKEFETRGVVYLQQFYDKHYPFKDIKVVGTEVQLYTDLGDNIKFQGIIDRLDKKDDNFIITDYKTNKSLPAQDEEYYREQLTLYALGVSQKYGKYFNKIYGNLEYLHFDYQDFWEIKKEDIQKVVEKYKKLTLEIETKKAEYGLGCEDVFEPIESSSCKFCDYKEICPLFSHFYGKVTDADFSEDTIKAMIDDYINLNEQKKDINDKIEKNKEILQSFAKRHNLKKLYGKSGLISLSNLVNYTIKDNEKLRKYLEKTNQLQDFLELDRHKIGKAIKNNKLSLKNLQDMVKETKSIVLRINKNK